MMQQDWFLEKINSFIHTNKKFTLRKRYIYFNKTQSLPQNGWTIICVFCSPFLELPSQTREKYWQWGTFQILPENVFVLFLFWLILYFIILCMYVVCFFSSFAVVISCLICRAHGVGPSLWFALHKYYVLLLLLLFLFNVYF